MYLTKEKQKLMLKNLNFLMHKQNITNTVMQDKLYGETDKNGRIIAKIRSEKRYFTLDDCLAISEFFNISIDIFQNVDLETIDIPNMEYSLLVRPDSFPKQREYAFIEVEGYNHVVGVVFSLCLFLTLIGAILSFFLSYHIKHIFSTCLVTIILLMIGLFLRRILTTMYHKTRFTLPESMQYYFVNKYQKPKKKFCIFFGVTVGLSMISLGFFLHQYRLYGVWISLLMLILICVHLITFFIFLTPKPLTLNKVSYSLYFMEFIRKYLVYIMLLLLTLAFYLLDMKSEYMIIYTILMAGILVGSEFMDNIIMNYYLGYTGRENK